MKVATSFISYEQAKKNLELELNGKDYDDIYNEARAFATAAFFNEDL